MQTHEAYDELMDLWAEAAGARLFATTFKDPETLRDLMNYASALDNQAAQLLKSGLMSGFDEAP